MPEAEEHGSCAPWPGRRLMAVHSSQGTNLQQNQHGTSKGPLQPGELREFSHILKVPILFLLLVIRREGGPCPTDSTLSRLKAITNSTRACWYFHFLLGERQERPLDFRTRSSVDAKVLLASAIQPDTIRRLLLGTPHCLAGPSSCPNSTALRGKVPCSRPWLRDRLWEKPGSRPHPCSHPGGGGGQAPLVKGGRRPEEPLVNFQRCRLPFVTSAA